MNITNKFITLLTCVGFGITACVGSDSDGGVKQPANLVSDTGAITTSGVNNTVTIKNIGQLPIVINNTTVSMEDTTDTISDASGCNNKTLSSGQNCQIKLTTYSGEAGITTLHLSTNNGIYDFPINIDTSGEGVVDNDIKVLETTKEKVVNILNKGALPIKLTSLKLEDGNKTLTVKDINCIGNIINAGSTCQISAKASSSQNYKHVLYVTTANTYMKQPQQLLFYERTDTNSLQLIKDTTKITSTINIQEPRFSLYTITNNGSNDINITTIDTLENNIGKITSNQCDGMLLQSGDNCTFGMEVNRDAYGMGNLTVNTKETLASPIKYQVTIDSPNLTVEDDEGNSNDIAIHTNSHEVANIINKSAFDVRVNDLSFNDKEVTLSNNCANKIISPGDKCQINLLASDKEDNDGLITIKEFDGNFTKQINLHITNGVSIIPQTNDSVYNAAIVNGGDNFYQVFIVNNPMDIAQALDVSLRNTSTKLVNTSDLNQGSFLLSNCVDDHQTTTINAHAKCELIIREPNDWNKIQDLVQDATNPDKGNLRIQIQYKGSQDTLLQKFQGVVNYHHVHEDSTYSAGYFLLPRYTIDPNSCSGFSVAQLMHSRTFEGTQRLSIGASLSVEPDTTTIKIDSFFNVWSYCYKTTAYLTVDDSSNYITIKDEGGNVKLQSASPTTQGVSYNGDHGEFTVSIDPGIDCRSSDCTGFRILVKPTDPALSGDGVQGEIAIKKPYPAKDLTVADIVMWNNLGYTLIKGLH